MGASIQALLIVIFLAFSTSSASAQSQSASPADCAVAAKISTAFAHAGIDPRTTSVRVITTSDHIVYLTGLISDKATIKLAGDVAAQTAPSYRIINKIHSSFFDDPNEVNGSMTK